MSTNNTAHSVRHLSQARSTQACQRCRLLKAKCIASSTPRICQRCLNSKRDCIWPESQERIRPPRGPSRISQVEKKIDGLVARITSHSSVDKVSTSEDTTDAANNYPFVRNRAEQDYASPAITEDHHMDADDDDERHDAAESLRELAGIHDFDSDSNNVQLETELTIPQQAFGSDHQLTQKILAEPKAEKLLGHYHLMAPSFPFVRIDPEVSLHEISRRKPMLTLAIMTVASIKDRKTQASLDEWYKRELAERTIIKPRKTIDLLQSILVRQAWYHYLVDPKLSNQSVFQIALGLTTELALEPQFIPNMLSARDRTKRIRGGVDGQRALLGCYYLSSAVAGGLRISNRFEISDHMLQCNSRLGSDCKSDADPDKTLSSMIDSQYLEHRVSDVLHPYRVQSHQQTQEQLTVQLAIWETEIREWKTRMEEREERYDVKLLYYSLEMELYDSVHRHIRKNPLSAQSIHDVTQINILSSCLEAGRSFLDTLISVSLEEFELLTWPMWVRLPRVILIVGMLTAPSEHHPPSWNVKVAKDRARLDLFVESLCFRMQSLTTFNPPSQPNPDFWCLMKTALQSVGKWYKRIATRGKPGSVQTSTTQSTNSASTRDHSDTLRLQDGDSALSQSASTYACTPESGFGTSYAYADPSWQTQPFFGSIACPMLKAGDNFEIDQFIDMGFWGDACPNLDINYHFTM